MPMPIVRSAHTSAAPELHVLFSPVWLDWCYTRNVHHTRK